MELFICIFGFIAYIIVRNAIVDSKLKNVDFTKVNTTKMAMDSGKSYYEIKKNLVNGKYNKTPTKSYFDPAKYPKIKNLNND